MRAGMVVMVKRGAEGSGYRSTRIIKAPSGSRGTPIKAPGGSRGTRAIVSVSNQQGGSPCRGLAWVP